MGGLWGLRSRRDPASLPAPHLPPEGWGKQEAAVGFPPLLPSVAMAMSPTGADPEETILNAFKVFDPEGKGLKSA